ncbi:MAG: hypothetical protein KDJ90_04500 [Nitratireductor sp.]|nr:hypothetical protein [Nitratireductor sp.]
MHKFGRLLGMGLVAFALIAPIKANAAEVYFIRGFMNVFSRGMDQMTAQLKARGVNAKSLSNGQWSSVASDIIKRYRQGRASCPIVIAGHSVGGQEAPKFADTLAKAGVPVSLVIGVDPGFAPPPPFTAGSPKVVNFWIKGSARGNPYRSTGGFHGSIQNIDIRSFSNADHVGIDKDPRVQSRIVGQVMSALGSGGSCGG